MATRTAIRNSLRRLHRVPDLAGVAVQSLCTERLGFLRLVYGAWTQIPGWLDPTDAHLLYSLAHHGPGAGAIVEIGSAWGKSTVFLARGSKDAKRERVYAIDPHTGDSRLLAGIAHRPAGLDAPEYRLSAESAEYSTLPGFQHTLRRFEVDDWVIPVVATSVEATAVETGPVRLLYIDGLHTYAGVKQDIEYWVPRLQPGGVVVFDDYFNAAPDVGVRRAVDEAVASGLVGPLHSRGAKVLVWTLKR